MPTHDPKILNVILESLTVIAEKIKTNQLNGFADFISILYDKNIVSKVEDLQTHPNNNVYKKSYRFITTFLETEESL